MIKKYILLSFFLFFASDFTATGSENRKVPIDLVKEIGGEKSEPGVSYEPKQEFTGEDRSIAVIGIKLTSKPIAEVYLQFSSSDSGEGKPKQNRFIFSPANWHQAQLLTIDGVDDDTVDGDQPYEIIVAISSDGDLEYDKLHHSKIPLVNKDNDAAGFVVKPVKRRSSEKGGRALYSIQLTSKPTADLVVPVFSGNKKEGVPTTDKIAFKPESWQTPVVVTVVGRDDKIQDGPTRYRIHHGPAESEDSNYRGKSPAAITLINDDNDRAGIEYLLEKKFTDEKGEDSHLTITLKSQPVESVTIGIKSLDLTEADVKPRLLKFGPENWKVKQSVRIIARDDTTDDGDQPYSIILSAKESRDKVYSSLPDRNVRLINKDDDHAGLVINKYDINTSEGGKSGKIGIKLNSQPISPVQLELKSHNKLEGKLLLDKLIFTDEDWFQEKVVTVIGVDDKKLDGDRAFQIEILPPITQDPTYSVLPSTVIQMINKDDEKVGFSIKKDQDVTREDGSRVILSIALNARPDHPVVLNLFSSNAKEAKVNPGRLEFQPAVWDKPQPVTVTGLPDGVVDGDQPFTIESSIECNDPKFTKVAPRIELINIDINRHSLLVDAASRETDETGRTAQLSVKPNAKPKGRLELMIESSDNTEGIPNPDRIVFDETNWSTPQLVEIKGIDDDVRDEDVDYYIKISAINPKKSGYDTLPPVTVPMVNLDNDTAGISVRAINPVTAEDAEVGTFAIKLNSEPTSSVVFIFSSSNPKEGEMIDYHAAFFPDNWNKEQIISVKGVKDYLVDGDREFYVTSLGAISKDKNYNKFPFEQMKFTSRDTDRAGFSLEEINQEASEDGDSAEFKIRLRSIPKSAVNLAMTTSDDSEGEVIPPHLHFTPENWNEGYTVKIAGREDGEFDGDQDFDVLFSPAESEDKDYDGLHPETIRITNRDSMRLTLGLTFTQFMLQEELSNSIDDSTVIGITAGYVLTRKLNLDFRYLQSLGTGSKTINKYNLDNPMEYTLNYSALSLGIKYTFMKTLVNVYAKTGLDLGFWELTSSNTLTGAKESNSDSSAGFYGGVGSDITLFGLITVAFDGSYHYMTRGLGNMQLSLSLKYPF